MSLRNKLDLQSFGDAFSLKNWWSEKYVLFVWCIPVLILIKLQILGYILVEKLKLHCNLRKKLAQDLFVCWELDSLGMKRFILCTLDLASWFGIWLHLQLGVCQWAEERLLYLDGCTRKLRFLTQQWGMDLKHASISSIKMPFSPFFAILGNLCVWPPNQ